MQAPCDKIRAMQAASSVKSPWSERIRDSGHERKLKYVTYFDPKGRPRHAASRPLHAKGVRGGFA